MKRQELESEFGRINYQIMTIKDSTDAVPEELISLSCQAVCVAICGSLEQCLKRIFVEYARRRSGNQIHRPIEKLCGNYQNPKSSRVSELVALFDKDFARELDRSWREEREIEKSHLDNLVGDRISVAHRTKNHVGISTSKLEDYYKAYSEILVRVYENFLG